MLTIGIELNRRVIALSKRILHPGLKAHSKATVNWQVNHRIAVPTTNTGGVIVRAIVDHNEVDIGGNRPKLLHGGLKALFFVICRNDCKYAAQDNLPRNSQLQMND